MFLHLSKPYELIWGTRTKIFIGKDQVFNTGIRNTVLIELGSFLEGEKTTGLPVPILTNRQPNKPKSVEHWIQIMIQNLRSWMTD